jgi:hypothetical protein
LTLYNDYNSSNGNKNGEHFKSPGSNQSRLYRITSPWLENVNWLTQPTTDTFFSAFLPADTNVHQDYITDVTKLVQDRIDNPTKNYGFMLKLEDETIYKCLLFATSNHPDASLHPKLVIYYSEPISISEVEKEEMIIVSPNPSLGKFNVKFNSTFINPSIAIYDCLGRVVFSEKISNSLSNHYNLNLNVPMGTYFLVVHDDFNKAATKVIIE